MAQALSEDRLRPFLSRRRRGSPIVELPPVGGILRDALDLTERLLPVRSVKLYLDDPARRVEKTAPLTLVALAPAERTGLGEEIVPGRGHLSDAYVGGKTLHRSSTKGSKHAMLVVPIRLEAAVCGVLCLERKGAGRFGPKERDVAELIARYLARAILNAVDILKQNQLALTDELTGLPSVRGLDNALHRAIDTAKADGSDLAVCFVDVDRLKRVNDVAGHRAGSEALRRVGEAMSRSLGDDGAAFRFGGDEFVIVMPKATEARARTIAETIREAVRVSTAGPFGEGEMLPVITVSVGIACMRRTVGTRATTTSIATRLVGAADRALYRAKERRDVVVFATRDDDPKKGNGGS